MRRRLCTSLGFLFIFLSLGVGAQESPQIRVAIIRDAREVGVSVHTGPYEVLDVSSHRSLRRGRVLKAVKIRAAAEGLIWGDQELKVRSILIQTKNKAGIEINKRLYRGDIRVSRDASGKLLVVNILDLEAYIQGVLVLEISTKWPMDAIKAQAVAARTYAVYQRELMKAKDYDVTADTSSQMYGGRTSEKSKTNRAVRFTKGEVLTYKGKVFPAFFHATCGGLTEDASELWNTGIAPLAGGRVCSFCIGSPHYHWKASMSLSDIAGKLRDKLLWRGVLADLSAKDRTPMGRIRTLSLVDAQGRATDIPAKEFRHALGPDVIRSTNFSLTLEKETVVFSGKGWGHGVGLCQWGALGMSKEGSSYVDILAFYYPGAKIVVAS
jgi:stage II sporulation protein D